MARPPSLSYFEHPPLHFWIAAGAEAVARVHGASPMADLAVRAPFIALFALTTWLMYRLTARLFNEPAGVAAALALNVSAVFTVSTGGWVLPDGPLMCAALAAVYCVVRAVDNDAPAWWLGAGLACGVALLSKYHGVLVIAGVFLFLVSTPGARRWLARPAPYLAVLIAALVFSPVLIWNARHGWISFVFQLGRNAPPHGRPLLALLQNIGGQIGFVLPWVWIPLIMAFVSALRAGRKDARGWLCCSLAIIPITLFTLASLGGNPGQPHWPALGYLFLFPLLGRGATAWPFRRWLAASFAVLGAAALIVCWRPPADLVDWKDIQQLDTRGRFVAAPSWIQAGKVAWALGPDVPVLCLSVEPHQFAFLRDPRDFVGKDGLLIMRPQGAKATLARYASLFAAITPLGERPITRLGRTQFTVAVFSATQMK